MMSVQTNHIFLDERGVAWIDDTNVKVIEVVAEKQAHGFSPEEMVFQHYGHLKLAQIHAALAYYYDNQAVIDQEINRHLQEYERLRLESPLSPGRKRLFSRKPNS